MAEIDEELSLARFGANPIADEEESEYDFGEVESLQVTQAPPPPEPPPVPKFDPDEHSPKSIEQEQEVIAARVEVRKPSPRYHDVNKERAKKSAATQKANREKDPEYIENKSDTEKLDALESESDGSENISFYDLASEKELQDFLKSTRVDRYKETFKLIKRTKNDNIKFRALQMLDNRDLGRPSSAPPPDNEDEPGGFVL